MIQDEVKKPLGDELLFGELEHGGTVDVSVANGELTFAFTSAAKPGATTALAVPSTVKPVTTGAGAKKPVLN